MEIIWIGGGFVIGIVLFLLLNEMFDVYYFGCAGISSTFTGCWIAGVLIIGLLGVIAKWIFIIGIVLWGISKLSKSGKTK